MTRFDAKLATAALATTFLLAAAAQAQQATTVKDEAKVVSLAEFDMSRYENGWLADSLRGATVYGRNDQEAGEVQSIIIGQDGRVERLIVETGGFADIGDKVISVPWSQIDTTPGKEGIKADLAAENLEDFSLFGDWEEAQTGPRSFRAQELIGDYVTLKGGENYGYVRDLVFDREGQLRALVVEPDIGWDGNPGYYAYPYYGYGYDYGYDFDPGLDYYGLPYGTDEIGGYEPFDYESYDAGYL